MKVWKKVQLRTTHLSKERTLKPKYQRTRLTRFIKPMRVKVADWLPVLTPFSVADYFFTDNET